MCNIVYNGLHSHIKGIDATAHIVWQYYPNPNSPKFFYFINLF